MPPPKISTSKTRKVSEVSSVPGATPASNLPARKVTIKRTYKEVRTLPSAPLKYPLDGRYVPMYSPFSTEDPGSSEVFKMFFPGWDIKDTGVTAREVFEPVNPVEQCVKTIGSFEENFKKEKAKRNDVICYLCGLRIPEKPTKPDGKYDTEDELYPECEHIIPVISARWYLDIYKGEKLSDEDRKVLETEYAWAHRVCNQAKLNALFVQEVLDKETGSIVLIPNRNNIYKALQLIQQRAKKNKNRTQDKPLLEQISKFNIEIQVESIVSNKIQYIIDEVKPIPFEERSMSNLARVGLTSSSLEFPKKLKESHQEWVQTLEPDKPEDIARYDTESRKNFDNIKYGFYEYYRDILNPNLTLIKDHFPRIEESFVRTGKILEKLGEVPTSIGNYQPLMVSIFAYSYLLDVLKFYRSIRTDNQQYINELCFIHNQLRAHLKTVGSITTLINSTPLDMRLIADYPLEDIQKLCNKIRDEQPLSDDAKESIKHQVEKDLEEDYFPEEEYPIYTAEEIMAVDGSLEELILKYSLLKDSKSVKARKQLERLTIKINKLRSERLKEGNALLSSIQRIQSSLPPSSSTATPSSSANYPYSSAAASSSSSSSGKPFGGKRRKTRRAKLFRRTRLTHRSDPSKRLMKLSFQKSRKGK
jgi:hypothetical protein